MKNSLIWKISAPCLQQPSYLFGTMHVQDKKAFKYIEQIKVLILQCEAFATEINLADENSVVIPPSLLRIPNEQSIESLIGDKKYQKLKRIILKAFGLDLDHYQNTIPILTANEIANSILSKDHHLSLDAFLSEYATTVKRKMLGIETFVEHLEVLQKIPLDYQMKSLLQIGKNVEKYRKHILKWAQLYEDGRLQQLYLSSKKSLGKMKRVLLYDRNLIMADRITEILKEQTLFCAVGAAHLPGEKGVLRLLKKNGMIVSPHDVGKL